MSSMQVDVETKEASLDIEITRCGCGDPLKKHTKDEFGNLGICPKPNSINNLGRVSYHHKNPIRSWWGNIQIALRRGYHD